MRSIIADFAISRENSDMSSRSFSSSAAFGFADFYAVKDETGFDRVFPQYLLPEMGAERKFT